MRMPWGKHEGKRLENVPRQYLRWVLANCLDADPRLRRAITGLLEADDDDEARPRPAANHPPTDWQGIIAAWYRDLALKWHPDRGGSTQAMQAINDAHERFKAMNLSLSEKLAICSEALTRCAERTTNLCHKGKESNG